MVRITLNIMSLYTGKYGLASYCLLHSLPVLACVLNLDYFAAAMTTTTTNNNKHVVTQNSHFAGMYIDIPLL